jgi:class 3 adenylate cyclase
MAAMQENAAVLFADISGSTALYDTLGNERALELVTRTLAILMEVMTAHDGVLVKTIGDEVMCVFPDAVTALNAAMEMQLAVEKQRPGGDQPIHVRIGLHYGEVLHESGDVFGDTVNIAARVTAITRASQIMTTQTIVDLLPEELRKKTRPVRRSIFRGKGKPFEVFHVHWEQERTTSTRIGRAVYRKPAESKQELMVRFRQKVVMVNEKNHCVVLGRDESCDMVIQTGLASRQHARLEYSYGKVLLTDFSKNGTFVRFSDGQVVHLIQQQVVLHGAGAISLGQPFTTEPGEAIEFLMQ